MLTVADGISSTGATYIYEAVYPAIGHILLACPGYGDEGASTGHN